MIRRRYFLLVFAFGHITIFSTWGPPESNDFLEESLVFEKKYVRGIDDRHLYSNSTDYDEKVKSLLNLTLDQKCDIGEDVGIGFHEYSPYVKIKRNDGNMLYVSGIFPEVTKELMKRCCPRSKIVYGNDFLSIAYIRESINHDSPLDITFPVYGQEGKDSTHVKDLPFIPIVTAPKIVLVVNDMLFKERNTRLEVVMNTICNAWPMLAFITVSATLAGLVIWLLDYQKNPGEFPPSFFSGSWEGIWWAFVTMTTVGYGDRSPKSTSARAFCILWILMGIVLISLFTGLVTSALSASTVPVFNIPGSKIGAVYGSIEYQVGVGKNADMKSYKSKDAMLDAMVQKGGLQAAMLDNFVLSANSDVFMRENLRMEREIDHPVTYGMVIGYNSPKIEKCFRQKVRWFPQRIFEIIADKLIPIKNPTDDIRVEVAAAKLLFYEEDLFKMIVYTEIGVLIIAFFIGMFWEIFVRNKVGEHICLRNRLGGEKSTTQSVALAKGSEEKNALPEELQTLVTEYNSFHSTWVDKVVRLCNRNVETHQF